MFLLVEDLTEEERPVAEAHEQALHELLVARRSFTYASEDAIDDGHWIAGSEAMLDAREALLELERAERAHERAHEEALGDRDHRSILREDIEELERYLGNRARMGRIDL